MSRYKKNKHKRHLSKTLPQEIYLSNLDRITHLGFMGEKRKILEVTNVSYEIKINDEWITIVRYDSVHGYLHRHKRVSLNDLADVPDREGVKRKGDTNLWYTWAIKDIQKRFLEYRAGFTKRSRITNLGY